MMFFFAKKARAFSGASSPQFASTARKAILGLLLRLL
jgi:hypothetical protein